MKPNKKLTINDFPKQIPDFKNSALPKDRLTEKWLTEWIINGLKHKKLKSGDILPKKQIIAQYLGISTGTVQNAIRYTEDKGYLQSIQKRGTFVSSATEQTDVLKKQTSKRDEAVYKIKKYIYDKGINYLMPPASEVAKEINISANTVRLAYLRLCDTGFLKYTEEQSKKKFLKVIKIPSLTDENNTIAKSLVEKTTEDLSKYISTNLKKGEKIQSRLKLAELFNVSVKTIHDAVTVLEAKGILMSRRGTYGTVVLKMPTETEFYNPVKEHSIFTKAEIPMYYRWEKTEEKLIDLINNNFLPGMKIPSMEDLSKQFDVSTNTVRRALIKLSKKGIVDFKRGHYGGTFVTEIPKKTDIYAYEWLAVNQDYANSRQVK